MGMADDWITREEELFVLSRDERTKDSEGKVIIYVPCKLFLTCWLWW